MSETVSAMCRLLKSNKKMLATLYIKGELNPKIKLDLNYSFCTLMNKYNPHMF